MAKTCAPYPECIPVCDFCHWFGDAPKDEHGVYISETGYCHFHKEPRDLTDACDDFWCFTLPFDGESYNPPASAKQT